VQSQPFLVSGATFAFGFSYSLYLLEMVSFFPYLLVCEMPCIATFFKHFLAKNAPQRLGAERFRAPAPPRTRTPKVPPCIHRANNFSHGHLVQPLMQSNFPPQKQHAVYAKPSSRSNWNANQPLPGPSFAYHQSYLPFFPFQPN